MKINELITDTVFTYSENHHPFVNPYNGCTEGCPFCYRLSTPGWEEKIDVYTNMAELLEDALVSWPQQKHIYMGSICDPYMPTEEMYGLTRQCLRVLNSRRVPVVITTKSDHDFVFRDVDLFTAEEADITVVIELAQVNQMKNASRNNGHNGNITVANRLHEMGVKVLTTIAPVLPEITDIEETLAELSPEIPLYLDPLNVQCGSIQAQRMKEFILRDYPHLTTFYENLIDNATDYFNEVRKVYNDRVCFMPFKL